MSIERHDTVFYDSNENVRFRHAVVDLARAAYAAAHEKDLAESEYENITGDLLLADDKVEIDGQRREYSFYAEKDGDEVQVQSIVFTPFADMTPEAVRLIHDEVLESDAPRELKAQLSYDYEEVQNAEVELFVRRSFQLHLATGDVRVKTDMGYTVEEVEVNSWGGEMDVTELDKAREQIFERDDFLEFVQALHTLELVTDEQVRLFLERF